MSTFSERQGYEEKKPLQFEAMDDVLRIGLWNALDLFIWSRRKTPGRKIGIPEVEDNIGAQPLLVVISAVWMYHLKRPRDSMPSSYESLIRHLREYYFDCDWNKVYDFIEYIAPHADDLSHNNKRKFIDYCNQVLEAEQSAYRFVNGIIAPITNIVEIRAIEVALSSPYKAVSVQVRSAVVKLSQKPEPDCRNCIKESIGAVETAVKLAANDPKATLPKLLRTLEEKINLHPAQVQGFEKLYSYTSDDESGIRHGMMDKDDLYVGDARYMMVSCSAFATYLLELAERAGILRPQQ